MQKSLVKQLAIWLGRQLTLAGPLLIFIVGFALSADAFAVGMGEINVGSALGQQLRADIELVAVSKSEKASLVARLASPDAYKNAGLDYPYGIKFKFQVDSRANGEPYLKVSTDQPINDPFVTLLVELSWSSGKLMREYTFLLDPPGYVPQQPAPAEVQAVAPSIQPASAIAPAPGEQPSEVTPIAPPVEATVTEIAVSGVAASGVPASGVAVSEPEVPAAPLTAEKLPELDEWIVVKRGDTMREVADQYRMADMSLDRMLVALYRANADRFDANNMNRIKAGKILRLPHHDEVEAVGQSEAVRVIHAQAADWNIYRQKLASAAGTRGEPGKAQQVAAGKITSSVADKTPVTKESAKEVLKLSRGEAPQEAGGRAAGGKAAALQDKLNAMQEEAIAKDNALKESNMRIAMLEKQVKDLKGLVELQSGLPKVKTEAAAPAQPPKAATPAGSAAASAAASSAAAAEKPKPRPEAPKAPVQESVLDQILGEPLYLGAGALLLILLGGAGYVSTRRKKKRYREAVEESLEAAGFAAGGDATGRMAAPVVSSPDTGDFTGMGGGAHAAPSENIDALAEADLFLNFGRDAQAEEILKEALQSTPHDHRIHLKLLGIYANRIDVNSFSKIARQLKDSGDDNAWQQALEMGRKLEPGNPMYGGSGAPQLVETAAAAAAIFEATQLFSEEAAPAAVDLELGGAPAAMPEEAALAFEVPTAQPSEMDFNLGAEFGGGAQVEVEAPEEGGLMFDVGSGFAPPAPEPEPALPAGGGEGAMEFTLDFPIEAPAEEAVPETRAAADIGLAGISLNFEEPSAAAESAPSGDEQWQEIATKLDLAKAYQEMGDASGAREILDEVMRDGDAGQREAAQALLSQLG